MPERLSSPSISVVIPVYNGERTIARALNSVARQTFKPWEVIVVNDGSTDGTLMVLDQIASQCELPRLQVLSRSNQGVARARNWGAEKAHGEYLAFLDADDEWHPTFLEVVAQLIDQFPQAVMWATGYSISSERGSILLNVEGIRFSEGEGDGGIIENWGEAIRRPIFTIGSVVIHRELFTQAGGFCPDADYEEDRDLFFRLGMMGKVAWSPRVGVIKHQEEGAHLVGGDRWLYWGMTPLGLTLETMLSTGVDISHLPEDVFQFLYERLKVRLFVNAIYGDRATVHRLRRLIVSLKKRGDFKVGILVVVSYLPPPLRRRLYYIYCHWKGETRVLRSFRSVWHRGESGDDRSPE